MKKTTWVFEFQKHGNFESILHTNFELFRWTISSSLNLLFLKSDFPMRWELFFPEHYVSIFRTLCSNWVRLWSLTACPVLLRYLSRPARCTSSAGLCAACAQAWTKEHCRPKTLCSRQSCVLFYLISTKTKTQTCDSTVISPNTHEQWTPDTFEF